MTARPARRLAPLLLAAVALGGLPGGARAAGETTHAFMAERAIDYVRNPELRTLLGVHRPQLVSGAAYPDTGYWVENGDVPVPNPGGSDDFGEISHWERFINAYVDYIRAQAGLPDLGGLAPPSGEIGLPDGRACANFADPVGPCAPLIAHLMGSAAHGMGDEIWDWLFEPRVTDHGEDAHNTFFDPDQPGHPLDGSLLDEASSSIEYAMDEVAIYDHFRWPPPNQMVPPVLDLVEVYERMGLSVTADHILAGHSVSSAAMAAERAVAPEEAPRVKQVMPWSAAHFVTEPGGVEYTAAAIAGYYEGLWRKLKAPAGQLPPAEVVAKHPKPRARGVPWEWLPPRTSPGPHTGGGEKRIIAVLSNAVDRETVTPSTFKLLGPEDEPVPALAGFPRAGPYGGADGTHTMLFYPAVNLDPCTRYTAVLTRGLRDFLGTPFPREQAWSFTTRPVSGAPGRGCGRGNGPDAAP